MTLYESIRPKALGKKGYREISSIPFPDKTTRPPKGPQPTLKFEQCHHPQSANFEKSPTPSVRGGRHYILRVLTTTIGPIFLYLVFWPFYGSGYVPRGLFLAKIDQIGQNFLNTYYDQRRGVNQIYFIIFKQKIML